VASSFFYAIFHVRQMGMWRHANIIGLRAFYVPNNGSLHSLLHGEQ
jgi:hypothetical protein